MPVLFHADADNYKLADVVARAHGARAVRVALKKTRRQGRPRAEAAPMPSPSCGHRVSSKSPSASRKHPISLSSLKALAASHRLRPCRNAPLRLLTRHVLAPVTVAAAGFAFAPRDVVQGDMSFVTKRPAIHMESSKPCLGAKTHTWCRRHTALHRCCGSAVDFHGSPRGIRIADWWKQKQVCKTGFTMEFLSSATMRRRG